MALEPLLFVELVYTMPDGKIIPQVGENVPAGRR